MSDPDLNLEAIRAAFPALHQEVHGKPLVYLDNAASTMKPQVVIDALVDFYTQDYSNVHRGVHALSQRATQAFEAARQAIASFVSASSQEIVLTRGTTESLNLLAYSWSAAHLQPGDEVVISAMEHHSNIVPWQLACARHGAKLLVLGLDEHGAIAEGEAERLLGPKTKVLSLTHTSNALGTVNDLAYYARVLRAQSPDAIFIVDGAQAVPHGPVDPHLFDADFFAFSGHKMFGPTGIGVLWGRLEHFDAMPPWHGGGDMIQSVSFEGSTYAEGAAKFEAGTPAIGETIGLGAAATWLMAQDHEGLARHAAEVLSYGHERLTAIPGLRLIGTAPNKTSVLSFVVDGAHPHDLGTLLDMEGVAVRVGHHCAEPVMSHFGVTATTRASTAIYTTKNDIDALADALEKALKLLL